VRCAWNKASIQKHNSQTGHVIYICDAEDVVGDNWDLPNMEQKAIITGMSTWDTKWLSFRVELTIGMLVIRAAYG